MFLTLYPDNLIKALRIYGLSADALVAAGIETVFDLIDASGNEHWHKPIKGIGLKNKMNQSLVEQIVRLYLTHPGVDADGIMTKMGL